MKSVTVKLAFLWLIACALLCAAPAQDEAQPPAQNATQFPAQDEAASPAQNADVWNEKLEQLASSGTLEQIKATWKVNKKLFFNTVFSDEKECFLMLALKNDRDLSIIKFCIESDTKLKSRVTTSGRTPLMYAAEYCSDERVIDLIIKNAALFKQNKKQLVLKRDKADKDSFLYARKNPNYKVYLELYKYAEDPNGIYMKDSSSKEKEEVAQESPPPPVEEAAEQEVTVEPEPEEIDLEALEEARLAEIRQYSSLFLLDYAEDEKEEESSHLPEVADPNLCDKYGVSLLMKAAKAGNDWDVKLLLGMGANPNLRDDEGWSALMYAARYQNSTKVMELLLDKGAYTRVRNHYNMTPLLMAAYYSENPEIVEILLRGRAIHEEEVYRAFIFSITGNTSTDHLKAAKVKLFLSMEVPLNRLWKGQTPLMYACQYGNSTEVIKLLLDAGARKDMKDEDGKTAFDYAKVNKALPHDEVYWAINKEK